MLCKDGIGPKVCQFNLPQEFNHMITALRNIGDVLGERSFLSI